MLIGINIKQITLLIVSLGTSVVTSGILIIPAEKSHILIIGTLRLYSTNVAITKQKEKYAIGIHRFLKGIKISNLFDDI